MKSPIEIYISLGSNIDPAKNLASARDELLSWLDDGRVSPTYQSPPVGMSGADFLNAVVAGRTSRSILGVVNKLLAIEMAHGRVRTANKFSDRTLDLDLLLYGTVTCDSKSSANTIVLPHPETIQQAYVLRPLADLAGELVHPAYNRSMSELCQRLHARAPEMFSVLTEVTLPLSD